MTSPDRLRVLFLKRQKNCETAVIWVLKQESAAELKDSILGCWLGHGA